MGPSTAPRLQRLAALPPTPVGPAGRLLETLGAGELRNDPLPLGPRRGRARRWVYAAAADAEIAVGAAVVTVGAIGAAFVWYAALAGGLVTWQARGLRGVRVGWRWGRWEDRDAVVAITDGDLLADVPTARGRLRVRWCTVSADTPAVLLTRTAHGGWNATRKLAGHRVRGTVERDGEHHRLDGAGWADATAGRQDRRTTWRWAAGGGRAADGRRVGFNASTGMNAHGPGEDVVWWDGVPYRLVVQELAPAGGDPAGEWAVAGPGWALRLTPVGVRAAREALGPLRSRYVQPVGWMTGTLPGPDGEPVAVRIPGVTELHEAVW